MMNEPSDQPSFNHDEWTIPKGKALNQHSQQRPAFAKRQGWASCTCVTISRRR